MTTPTIDRYADMNPAEYVIECPPNGPIRPEWADRFVGVKVGDNPNGTWRVLVCGEADDFHQSVLKRG
jgi:hypothetical protein